MGLRLGEPVSLSVLRDQTNKYVGENFEGFTITTFDGTTVIVYGRASRLRLAKFLKRYSPLGGKMCHRKKEAAVR
jgi:hypothetical protein